MKGLLLRYWRCFEYLFRWLFFERPRGLDFSMRAKKHCIKAKGSSGYALTSNKALARIFRDIPVGDTDRFIDIGCGKGGVLCFAAGLPFSTVTGLEIEPWLVQIAKKNVSILKLESKIDLICDDALKFDRYGDYSHIFMFNPFDLDIYGKVVERISDSIRERDAEKQVWLVCYGASNYSAVKDTNLFELYREEVCPYRGTAIKIWKTTN